MTTKHLVPATILAAALTLAGCNSVPLQQRLTAQCQSYGHTPGTDNFMQCMQIGLQAHAIEEQERARRIGLAQQGFSMMQQSGQQPRPMVTCNHVPGSPFTTCQ